MTPPPMTPADCDLQDFSWFALDVVRLRDSDLAANETPEACWAALLLWAASWHQVPAASIPDDDKWIAKAAGYMARGKIDKAWADVRDGALRGFVKCADGRLYHPVMAEKAREAWIGKLRQRWATEAARIKKFNQRHDTTHQVPEFEDWLAGGCPCGQPLSGARDKRQMSQGTQPKCPQGQVIGVPKDDPPMSPECPSKTGSKGEGEGDRYINTESIRQSGSTGQQPVDDYSPRDWEAWRQWFDANEGIETDPYSVHDRTKFRKLAQPWVKAGVTVGQMRAAIAKAKAESTEPIAYLPAYVDRVLAGLNAPPSTRPPTRVEGAAAAIFDTGSNHGEVIDA